VLLQALLSEIGVSVAVASIASSFVFHREKGSHVLIAIFVGESNGVVNVARHAGSIFLVCLSTRGRFVEGAPEDTLDGVGHLQGVQHGVSTTRAITQGAVRATVTWVTLAELSVVKIPCRVVWVLVGNGAAATVAVAVVRAGSACAAFAFVTGETGALASRAIAATFVGTLAVKVSLIVWRDTGFTSVTIVVTVEFRLTATNKVDTVHLGVQSRVEVTSRTMFAITVKITNRSINESSTVGANSLTAVSSKPIAVAVTLRGFTTRAMSSTVVWARRTGETKDR